MARCASIAQQRPLRTASSFETRSASTWLSERCATIATSTVQGWKSCGAMHWSAVSRALCSPTRRLYREPGQKESGCVRATEAAPSRRSARGRRNDRTVRTRSFGRGTRGKYGSARIGNQIDSAMAGRGGSREGFKPRAVIYDARSATPEQCWSNMRLMVAAIGWAAASGGFPFG